MTATPYAGRREPERYQNMIEPVSIQMLQMYFPQPQQTEPLAVMAL